MIKKTIQLTAYRMRVRKAISNQPVELVEITLDECKRFLERKKK